MQADHASNSSWEDESSAMPVAVGDILDGKYKIVRVLGKGGMGVVMAAVHVELGHRVALKFLSRSGAQNDENLVRFAREARAAAMIQSEHATRVLDIGRLSAGEPYMVLEMLEGCDLGALVTRRGPLSVEDAVTYVLEACEAIAEAHSLGIVHRDLKPDNLFLVKRPDGTQVVKVLDFGISKFPTRPEDRHHPQLTTTSAIIGSPMYMSPEQLRATRDVDHRSDIWSLGITIYELISGQIPFPWKSFPELSAAILKDPPVPLSNRVKSVPAEFDAIIMRCLEKNPLDRYDNVAELAHALAPFGRPAAASSAAKAAQLLARKQVVQEKPTHGNETIQADSTSIHERTTAVVPRFSSLFAAPTRPAPRASTAEQFHPFTGSSPSPRLGSLPMILIVMVLLLLGGAGLYFGPWWTPEPPVLEARRGIAKSVPQATLVPIIPPDATGSSEPTTEDTPRSNKSKSGHKSTAGQKKTPGQTESVPTTEPDAVPPKRFNPFAERE